MTADSALPAQGSDIAQQTPLEELRFGEQRRRDRRVVLTSYAAIVYKAVDAITKFVIIPMAARLLGVERYGIWLTAGSVLNLIVASDFGLGSGLINAVGRARAEGDIAGIRGYTATAYATLLAFAVCLLIVVTILTHNPGLPHWLGVRGNNTLADESRSLFFLMGWLIGVDAILNLIGAFASALQEGYFTFFAFALGSISSLLWILHLHAPTLNEFALASSLPVILSLLFLSAFMFFLRTPELRPDPKEISWQRFRSIWGDSSRLLIAQIADTVVACAANIIIAYRLGSSRVPEASVSLSVMMIFNFLSSMFVLPLWGAYVEALVRRDWAWIERAFRQGVSKSLGSFVLCAACYCAVYKTFLQTWSPTLPVPALSFVVALSLWFLLYVWNKNMMVLLNALGYTNIRAWLAPLSAAIFVCVSLLTIGQLGLLAIPLGGLASAAAESLMAYPKVLALLHSNQHVSPALGQLAGSPD